MEIKLNIGEPIQKPDRRDTFILHVKSMSGDADEFHTNTLRVKTEEGPFRINALLGYFVEYSKLDWNTQCDLTLGLLKNKELQRFSDIEDDLRELIGRDVCYDGDYASPDSVCVTYVDSENIEHHVDIQIDGVGYSRINRGGLIKNANRN